MQSVAYIYFLTTLVRPHATVTPYVILKTRYFFSERPKRIIFLQSVGGVRHIESTDH
ncbi:MAG: hypothetical protein ACJ748_16345 [Flavisolibacter sp.]